MSEFRAFSCSSVGISGTTQVFVRQVGEGYVARVGIAILGTTHLTEEALKTANPFMDFRDNYAEGKGKTSEEAVAALKRDIDGMSESLWL